MTPEGLHARLNAVVEGPAIDVLGPPNMYAIYASHVVVNSTAYGTFHLFPYTVESARYDCASVMRVSCKSTNWNRKPRMAWAGASMLDGVLYFSSSPPQILGDPTSKIL